MPSDQHSSSPEAPALKSRIHRIIFGTDTPAGKLFDVVLIYTILASVGVLMLDSIIEIRANYGTWLLVAEWIFTILFTIEFVLRLWSSSNRVAYLRSFYGVIDVLALLPSYLALFLSGANYFLIIRILRVLRVFRVFKLARYTSEANVLLRSMAQARRKISVFFMSVLLLCAIFGAIMYLVEGPENGFTSIPRSVYWTIVTITTVGYGDITPVTVLGQIVASIAMLTGYSIIAVPTGIVTAELANEMQKEFRRERTRRACDVCLKADHDNDAQHCKYCGSTLPDHESQNL